MLPAAPATVIDLANAIWHGFEFFPNAMPTAICQQYLLSLLFLRAVSTLQAPSAANPPANMPTNPPAWQQCGLLVPHEAQMGLLFAHRSEPGNGARIDRALDALTSLNPAQLGTRLSVMSFDSPLLGGPAERDELLSALLCHFMQDALLVLDQQPTLFGEVFSEVLGLFACHYHSSAQYFTSVQPDIERDMTPRPVAQLMARLLNPTPNEAIYDPACGNGGLLLASAQSCMQVHQGVPRLFGQELNADRCALARMRLTLYGMDATQIVFGDALARASSDATLMAMCMPNLLNTLHSMPLFDVVLSAPPLVVHPDSTRQNDDITPIKRAGLGFALTKLSRLQPTTGRMAVLLPVSALTRSDQHDMRKELVRANAIASVILLPACLLQHYPEPACVVLMRRCLDYAPVFVVDARQLQVEAMPLLEDEPVQSPAQIFLPSLPLLDEVIGQIANAFLPKRDIPGLARLVTWAEVEQVKYDFTSPLLIDPSASSDLATETPEIPPKLCIQ